MKYKGLRANYRDIANKIPDFDEKDEFCVMMKKFSKWMEEHTLSQIEDSINELDCFKK